MEPIDTHEILARKAAQCCSTTSTSWRASGWVDNAPNLSGIYNDSRPPAYVAGQLQAFRQWSMDGTFGIYAYDALNQFDYTPYVAAMNAAACSWRASI